MFFSAIIGITLDAFDICIDSVVLPLVSKTTFLGIWIDNKLNWDAHVGELIQKLKQKTKLLGRGNNFLSTHCKRILYFAQIYSHIQYGISLWGNMCCKVSMEKIQKVQK